MPWMETCPMRERMSFVTSHQGGLYTMSELCERYGVSRRTGYKWLERFEEEGEEGLQDRSRRPHRSPARTPERVERLLIEVRQAHPRWGPEKLLSVVAREHGELELPARSTVAAILKREGLVSRRRRRRPHRHPGCPMTEVTAPNEVWTADFKGQFRTRDGRYCYPLTIADEHSRYILGCTALPSVRSRGVRPVFTRLFQEHGLPEAIRTDNGPPFASPQSAHGLSALNVWWIQLGIRHHRIEPGKPQQNGRHERMHRTLKDETTRPMESNLRMQQRRFDGFRQEFNHQRPHQALGQKVPAQVWQPSPRPFPEATPKPDYPDDFEKRRVSSIGNIRFRNKLLFLTKTLQGESVALEEIDNGIWSIYYYDVLIARLDERTHEVVT